VFLGTQRFHGEWDDVSATMKANGSHFGAMLDKAKNRAPLSMTP
jgi:hypothetical protein